MKTADNKSAQIDIRNREGAPGVKVMQLISDARAWQFFNDQPEFLRANGIDLHAASSPGPLQDEFGRIYKVPVYSVPISRELSPLSDLLSVWRLYKILRRVQPDILHAHFSKPGIIGMAAGVLGRTPIRIYHNHGMALTSARGWRWLVLWIVEKLCCLLAHRVVYIAPSVLADALRLGVCAPTKGSFILSANGLDATNRFSRRLHGSEDRGYWRRFLQIPDDAFVVGFVGRIFKIKGIEDLIHAWQQLADQEPRLHLLLVGELDARLPISEWATETISSESRVHMAGFVENIASVYPAMDVLALPSYHEGLPYSLLEGEAMELPVIGTRISGIVDVIRDGVNGILVEPEQPGQLAAAILKYMYDSQLAAAHGKAGRTFVIERFQRNAVWESILQTYDQLQNRRLKRSYAEKSKTTIGGTIAVDRP
jgi:glycosyltransferase involved in cell wall biosynthesis